MKHVFKMVMFLTIIFSCKKAEKITSVENQPIYKIENGVVVFSSLKSYANFIDNNKPEDLHKFIQFTKNAASYESLGDTKTSEISNGRLVLGSNSEANERIQDLLSDSLLSSMINSDGLVQIGDYLFNIDVENEKCYALHTSHLTGSNSSYFYNLILNGNSSNNFVIEFSTDDDVIDFLTNSNYPVNKDAFNGANPVVARPCGETNRRGQKDDFDDYIKSETTPGYSFFVSAKLVYQKAGIYFALFGKLQNVVHGLSGLPGFSVYQADGYQWRFKPRCWNERFQPYTITGRAPNKRYAWQSTRGLSKFDMTIQYFIYVNGNLEGIVPELKIKDGY